ncbi:MAG TPA: choice-of-anchor tandem repeat NxxGxxAF-containing protein [Lacipirellulaceae bacterium]
MIRIPCPVALSLLAVLAVFEPNSGALAATVRTVALEGQQAPGLSSGVRFDSFSPPVINAAGQTAFESNLTGDVIIGATDLALWSEGSGSLALVARQWRQAPGAPTGVNFHDFDTPVLNAAGQIAFHAWLASGRGVWSGSANNLRVVAQSGDQPPGVSDGRVFGSFGDVRLNSEGEIAFRASLSGVDGTGIWSERAGELVLIARPGSPAPGTPSGTVYDSVGTPVLNGAGQTTFGASLPGPNF